MPRFSRQESASDYPELREMLAPKYRQWSAENIEALFESYNLSAQEMEGFFDTLKDIGKAVVNVAPSILPVAGTVVGTAFGGPAGGALGGALGNLAGGAISQATAPRQPQPSIPPAAPSPQGLPPGPQIPGVPQSPPGAAPAAGQLMQTMFRPEMLQALMQMMLGQLGASNVKVGSTPVPVGAFGNMVGTLANQAQAEYNAANPGMRGGLPEYMRDYASEVVGDPAVAEHRAEALYELLQETDVEQFSPRPIRRSYQAAYAEADGEDEVFYVELEPAEDYAEDEF